MWKFIKQVFATFFAMVLALLLVMVLAIAILAGTSGGAAPVEIKDNSVLQLRFNKQILETEEENPFEGLDLPFASDKGGMGLVQIVNTIAFAKTDPKIKGIYLDLQSIPAGFAVVDEIREALIDFKTSGKFIYAYSENYYENAYYLASVADRICLNPVGLLEFNGVQYKSLFFKGALSKLEIEPQIFRVGTYKSAVEPFMLDKMSEANRTQSLSFISSINNYHIAQIAASRNIPESKVKTISDSMLVHNASDAKRLGIVTDLMYYDEVLDLIKTTLKLAEGDKISFVSYAKYKGTVKKTETESDKKIAVLVAQGDIVQGKGDDESIGSDVLAEEIRKLRLDDQVKAVVLRINSPGGSALASDVMWREVTLLAKKKPIVASMSDVAASGGYYLAMGCTKIVADKNSITGSIGVFGLILNMQNFFKNKLGITYDGVQTGTFSDLGTPLRPLTPYEKQVIQNEVNGIYTDFITKAAAGRKLSVDSLNKLASGRVWSGIEAASIGLVDTLGGLQTAINTAASLAKLDSAYTLKYVPSSKSFFEKMLDDLQNESALKQLRAQFGVEAQWFETVRQLKKQSGIQARLPIGVEVE